MYFGQLLEPICRNACKYMIEQVVCVACKYMIQQEDDNMQKILFRNYFP
jgi:hypothetical protein